MSEDRPEITSTTLTLSVGATVSVNGNVQSYGDWIRPSASYAISWAGIPTEEQLRLATKFTQQEVLAPAIEDVIVQISQRLLQSRKS